MQRARPFLISGAMTALIMGGISFFISDPTQAKGTWCAGLIAAITIAAIPVYDLPGWSLAKRSLVHFGVMLITVLPLLLISGWFSVPLALGVFLLFGLVGWSIGYSVNRLQERKASRPR